MLPRGQRAPEFTLPDHAGRLVSLSSLRADGRVVIFFYPGDFTPICTREVCMVRDIHAELAASGLQVAGISPDDADTHARFRAKYGLPYALLADTEKRTIKDYGVDGPLGIGVRRVSFLIEADGEIADVLCADWRLARHTAFLQRAIASR